MKLFKQKPIDEDQTVWSYRQKVRRKIIVNRFLIGAMVTAAITLFTLLFKNIPMDEKVDEKAEFKAQALVEMQQLQATVEQHKQEYAKLEAQQKVIHENAKADRERLAGICAYLGDDCPLIQQTGEVQPTPESTGDSTTQSAPEFHLVEDSNGLPQLTDTKQWDRWRLNANGISQRPYHLVGNTVEDRAKDLLMQAGNPPHMREEFKMVGKIQNIKPEFLVCLYYQENSLHPKNMKTESNPLNVGNNDRGDTMEFDTMVQGINAAAQLSLNGKYLKHYTELRQLYGSTNPTGPVYTTEAWTDDQGNMHRTGNGINNSLNCLGMIYNNQGVKGSYLFRATDFSYLTQPF